MLSDPQRIQLVFTRAADLLAGERAALLDVECRGDAALRARIEALLAAHDAPGDLFERPPAGIRTTSTDTAGPPEVVVDRPGAAIGVYRLLEKIGEGGFGVVFEAEQQQPVRRRVALKLVKPGMDSAQVLRRFETERQALALMDHPNIAKVFDAGTAASGRPYFAMELVKGVPITKCCDDLMLSIRERLELFVPVSRAIQHAHKKGVVHRDVKPSNVLVCLHDGRPVPKVIDFGVAKALDWQLDDRTACTDFGTVIGTFEYMAPEQAELSVRDVDTRADIYALGVLLYELLTGTTPLDPKRPNAAGLAEMMRLIKEEEPPKPSTRITTLGERLSIVASARKAEPAQLRRSVRGDLDWIVMKCLEKDRDRRYETAEAVARDVERHLANESVEARPLIRSYRIKKFARRNKGPLAAAAAIALALVTGTAVAVWQAVRATSLQQLAEERSDDIRADLIRLKAANVLIERGRQKRLTGRWDEAEIDLSKAIKLRPDQFAGWTERHDLYIQLGLWDLASDDLTRALQIREPDRSFDWYLHSLLRMEIGDEDGYRDLRQQACDRFRDDLNPASQIDVARTCVLGTPVPQRDAIAVADLAERLMASRNQQDWFSNYIRGLAHYRAADYSRAVELLRASTEFAAPHAEMGFPCLAMAHYRLGNAREAREALEAAAGAIDRWTQSAFASDTGEHWVTRDGADPVWPAPWWDWLEFRILWREAKVLIDASPPADDARCHALRARAFAGLHRMNESHAEYQRALRLRPHDKLIRYEASRDRGSALAESGRFVEAADEFVRATEYRPEDVKVWRFRALAHFASGDLDAYRADCTALLDRFGATDNPVVASNVAYACTLSDDVAPDIDRLLRIGDVAAPQWHTGTWARGAILYRARRYKEAVLWFGDAARKYSPRAWDWAFLAMSHYRLGQAQEARLCLAQASKWMAQADHNEKSGVSGSGPAWGGYHERFIYPLLVREAEQLISASNE